MPTECDLSLTMQHLSLLLALLLLAAGQPDPQLEGTWHCIQDNELCTATFNADASFSLDAMGLSAKIDQLQAMGMEVTSNYNCTPGDPNRIQLLYEIKYEGKLRTLKMNGIYDFPDATTLRLDFRPDSLTPLETFSPIALSFTNDLNALEEMLPAEDAEGNYVFSYEKDGVMVSDTITPNDRAFYGIDSVYRKIVGEE